MVTHMPNEPVKKKPKRETSAPESQPTTVDKWFQPLSEPMRPLTPEDVDKIRRDERRRAKADQAGVARAGKPAAKDQEKQQQLAVIRQELGAGDPGAKHLLYRVNKHLPKPISLPTLYRRLRELKGKK
jgi:hypothetical protein